MNGCGSIKSPQNLRSTNAPEASDDFGGTPRAEVDCADARKERSKQTTNRQSSHVMTIALE
jgi:hypothetical protein